jgi:hypothetical protein
VGRLKRLARSDDSLEFLKSWWTRTFNETEDRRAMVDLPFASVLLRFYRSLADRLRALEGQKEKEREDWTAIESLKQALDPKEDAPQTIFDIIEAEFHAVFTSSDDPVWDKWLAAVHDGNLPPSWWGDAAKRKVTP